MIATADGKASLVVAVTDDLTAKISAIDLVRVGAEAMGGKGGGGRPEWHRPEAQMSPPPTMPSPPLKRRWDNNAGITFKEFILFQML